MFFKRNVAEIKTICIYHYNKFDYMPIIKDSTPCIYPAPDAVMVKYFDLTKFISMLQRRSLFFCRLDKLEDRFEGTTSKPNLEYRYQVEKKARLQMQSMKGYAKVETTDPNNEISIKQSVKDLYEYENYKKSITCINCWNNGSMESVALWKIYSDFGKGIMIKSEIKNIEKAFDNTNEIIRVSEITYIDFLNDLMPDYNLIYPFIHKDVSYTYENEIRLIYEVTRNDGGPHKWESEEVEEGKYLECDLNLLIKEIIIAPNAPTWYFSLILDLCIKYNLNKPVTNSRMGRKNPIEN